MKLFLLSQSLLLLTLLGCSAEKRSETSYLNYRVALDSITKTYASDDTTSNLIDLCALFKKTQWDSVAVILPYLPKKYLDEINFYGNTLAKDSMQYVIGVDWAQGLLFFNDNRLSNYSVIHGTPSFKDIEGLRRSAVPILKRSECQVMLVNVPSGDGDQSFFFLPRGPNSKYLAPDPIKEPTGSLDSLLGH